MEVEPFIPQAAEALNRIYEASCSDAAILWPPPAAVIAVHSAAFDEELQAVVAERPEYEVSLTVFRATLSVLMVWRSQMDLGENAGNWADLFGRIWENYRWTVGWAPDEEER